MIAVGSHETVFIRNGELWCYQEDSTTPFRYKCDCGVITRIEMRRGPNWDGMVSLWTNSGHVFDIDLEYGSLHERPREIIVIKQTPMSDMTFLTLSHVKTLEVGCNDVKGIESYSVIGNELHTRDGCNVNCHRVRHTVMSRILTNDRVANLSPLVQLDLGLIDCIPFTSKQGEHFSFTKLFYFAENNMTCILVDHNTLAIYTLLNSFNKNFRKHCKEIRLQKTGMIGVSEWGSDPGNMWSCGYSVEIVVYDKVFTLPENIVYCTGFCCSGKKWMCVAVLESGRVFVLKSSPTPMSGIYDKCKVGEFSEIPLRLWDTPAMRLLPSAARAYADVQIRTIL